MTQVIAYHRPTDIAEAARLLARPGQPTRVLAGGTLLNAGGASAGEPCEVVDLQALGLAGVSAGDTRVSIGAMTRLQELVDQPLVPSALRDLARRETPSTLRTLATVGGTVAAAAGDSELLAGLLVHDAVVSVCSGAGSFDVPLPQLLAHRSATLPGAVITGVSVAVDGPVAVARTGRTPADVPIVAAVARRLTDGRVRLALTGVAAVPVLVDDPSSVDPPGDFRGSSAYRRSLAVTLSSRVLAELGA